MFTNKWNCNKPFRKKWFFFLKHEVAQKIEKLISISLTIFYFNFHFYRTDWILIYFGSFLLKVHAHDLSGLLKENLWLRPCNMKDCCRQASENLFCQVFCMCRVIMSNYDSTHNIANFAVVSCIDEAKLSEREERGAGVVNPY